MELLLLTCADSGVIDATSNRLSVFQLFEEIQTPTFPIVIPRISTISMVRRTWREKDKYSAELLITLNNKTLVRLPWVIDFATKLKATSVGDIQGLVIPTPGTLRFELRVKNKPLGEWRVQVKQIEPTQIVPKPPPPVRTPPMRLRAVAKPVRKKRKKR